MSIWGPNGIIKIILIVQLPDLIAAGQVVSGHLFQGLRPGFPTLVLLGRKMGLPFDLFYDLLLEEPESQSSAKDRFSSNSLVRTSLEKVVEVKLDLLGPLALEIVLDLPDDIGQRARLPHARTRKVGITGNSNGSVS
ncbi:MAG: hypothetical protein M0C28_00435 [Candidatus Moduliflexus flocculans]|nr:hypothetical protein [Candidatus Moduliflexus flocculans]